MASTNTPTAWGDATLEIGEVQADGTMASELENVGIIDADSLTVELTDGTIYQYKDINGKLLDELEVEGELNINFTLKDPSEETMGKFWDVKTEGSGDTAVTWVKSILPNKQYCMRFSNPRVVGSRTWDFPVVKIKMKPGWEVAKGYNNPCTASVFNTGAKGWFGFGKVAAPTEGA